MNKLKTVVLTIIITIISAGIFGIIHDQITYTLSHEYFTKFKFYQFGLVDIGNEALLPNPRTSVAFVGFMATWWAGIFIGLGLGLTGLIFKDHKKMFKAILKSIFITFLVTIITSLCGFFYGKYYLTKTGVDWWLPSNLIDKNKFITVGSIHNFSYLGGLLGLICGIAYLISKNKSERLQSS